MRVNLIRSWKRERTVSGKLVAGELELRVPAALSPLQIKRFIRFFKERLKKHQAKNEKGLFPRAKKLEKKYLKTDLSFAISWSKRQQKSYGVCLKSKKTIRISQRLKLAPGWVTDYVIIHELAHLTHPNHQKKFWELVKNYPKAERARGFLEGAEFKKELIRKKATPKDKKTSGQGQ